MTDPKSTHHRPSRLLVPNNSGEPVAMSRAEMVGTRKQIESGWAAFCARRGMAAKTSGWRTYHGVKGHA